VSASGIAARFVLVLLLYATGVLGGAPATRQEEARSLAEQAFAANQQGNQLESGWEAAYDHGIALANQAIALDPDLADAYYALFLNIGRKSERGGVGSQMRNLSHVSSAARPLRGSERSDALPNSPHSGRSPYSGSRSSIGRTAGPLKPEAKPCSLATSHVPRGMRTTSSKPKRFSSRSAGRAPEERS
jgi:hypothetical protein